jgi:hypothetical protein
MEMDVWMLPEPTIALFVGIEIVEDDARGSKALSLQAISAEHAGQDFLDENGRPVATNRDLRAAVYRAKMLSKVRDTIAYAYQEGVRPFISAREPVPYAGIARKDC